MAAGVDRSTGSFPDHGAGGLDHHKRLPAAEIVTIIAVALGLAVLAGRVAAKP